MVILGYKSAEVEMQKWWVWIVKLDMEVVWSDT